MARRGGFTYFDDEAAVFMAALERGDAARHQVKKGRLKLDIQKDDKEWI